MSTPIPREGWRPGKVWCASIIPSPRTQDGWVYYGSEGTHAGIGLVHGVELVYLPPGVGETWQRTTDPAIVNLPLEDLKRYALTLWRMG
jgi:hypothetical protein